MSAPSYRCPDCQSSLENPRNLVVFIDGTSNNPSKKTNVMKLFGEVKSVRGDTEPEQRKNYWTGIGAYEVDHLPPLDRVGKAIYSSFEIALAWNVEKNIKDSYGWLVENYEGGNQIYLFGFSRGAYQVRALASMIHEVGLVKEKHLIDLAYARYLSINPYKDKTRQDAKTFKKDFCWPGVRIHFVGVWDTVSSLGLIKEDVHITASASVTNACHFRHALALDERRVKFMPEYFGEVNAHRSNIQSPASAIGDVKEVWFAGSHSDVGGISRPQKAGVYFPAEDNDPYPRHAGNVPLLWMRQEAAANGLFFDPDEFTWDPVDVDLGRMDTMSIGWKCLEVLPIRHQVSFSGAGKHKQKWHRSQARSVIPAQQIHSSVLSSDVYAPLATLGDSVDIPTVPRSASGRLWTTEFADEGATTRLLTSLLSDQRKTLESLEKVLFLLNFSLDNGQTQTIPRPRWSEMSIREQSGFDKVALTVIYDVISNFSVSEELVRDASSSLADMLLSHDHPFFPRAVYILQFSTRHRRLRQRIIVHDKVIRSLMFALEQTAMSPSKNLFPLIMDSLCYLIHDDDLRDNVIEQLRDKSDVAKAGQTRLSVALEVKAPSHLVASLRMIASVAQYDPRPCDQLKPRMYELAKKGWSPVGSAAVAALVALNARLTRDIHFSNTLGYLSNTLPQLDVEIGSTSPPDDIGTLPPVFNVNGSGKHDEELMSKLVVAIESRNARMRTAATLTLLKLCNYSMIPEGSCPWDKVLVTFMRQLERKETSLLAAYALQTCLKRRVWTPGNLPHAGQLIVTMLDKGWFDDAVGQVEGSKIFRELVTSGPNGLRQQVIDADIFTILMKKLEGGERHEVRMSLICLDIMFESEDQEQLRGYVEQSLGYLRDNDERIQKKGIKILAALAQTVTGEQAIKPHVIDIVNMMLPLDAQAIPRSRFYGPAAAVYDLCKNETLRKQIQASREFSILRAHYRPSTQAN